MRRPKPQTLRPLLLALLLGAGGGCATTNEGPRRGSYDPTAISAVDFAKSRQERCEALQPAIKAAAQATGLDPALLVGIVRVESNFHADARSRVGAMGLMQLMPATASGTGCGDPWDPTENVMCGAKVLARFMKAYDGKLVYAVSAYHAGWRWPNSARDASRLPKNFGYVEKVLVARAHFLKKGCAP